jgi:hypothetical protein
MRPVSAWMPSRDESLVGLSSSLSPGEFGCGLHACVRVRVCSFLYVCVILYTDESLCGLSFVDFAGGVWLRAACLYVCICVYKYHNETYSIHMKANIHA